MSGSVLSSPPLLFWLALSPPLWLALVKGSSLTPSKPEEVKIVNFWNGCNSTIYYKLLPTISTEARSPCTGSSAAGV